MLKSKNSSVKNIPHVFLILLLLVILSSILTYIVPAGLFQRVSDKATGQTLVVAGSYSKIANTPVAPWKIPIKLFEEMTNKNTAQLIFFILFIGGSFEIIMKTESINIFFERILLHFKEKRFWIVPVFVTGFSVLGFTMGLTTASIIFVPIGILAARMLKFDKLTGTAMVALGANAGFAAGILNPFSVGIAQKIAEVPIYSGAWIRWLLLVVLLVVTSFYIIYNAKKNDMLAEEENTSIEKLLYKIEKKQKLSLRQKHVLIAFFLTLLILIYGIYSFKWKIENIAVLLFASGIACGVIYGFNANEICSIFTNGCKKMMTGVFVIGLAGTMRLILSEGQILDTVAYYLTKMSSDLPKSVSLLQMFYGNAVLDLLITSGSAHASVVMPIMTPMADYLHISRQATVFAFQLGDGLVNLCSPLSTTLTGILAVSDIPYAKWIRFFLPLVGIYMIIGTGFILLAAGVGY